jgi:hypothetical protein
MGFADACGSEISLNVSDHAQEALERGTRLELATSSLEG